VPAAYADGMPTYLYATLLLLSVSGLNATDHADQWWRGNTHTHTTLCGHADSTPEEVAKWYLDHGYNFLVLSEHDRFIDPRSVKLPEQRRADFILVPGQEISKFGSVHFTAFNVQQLVEGLTGKPINDVIEKQCQRVRELGGVPLVNHPNWNYAVSQKNLLPLKSGHHFELYNGHPTAHNDGDSAHPSCEAMWDFLLTEGLVMYGASSDDAHTFQKISPTLTNPGRGWIMVRAPKLEPDTLEAALDRGDFYASSGVFLADVACDAKEYRVVIDLERTEQELKAGSVIPRIVPKEEVPTTKPGWRIDFIGPGGVLIKSESAGRSSCARDKKRAYTRAHITFTRTVGERLEQVSAWTQPVFEDGRLAMVAEESVRSGWAKSR
jgi:hypothetical protein